MESHKIRRLTDGQNSPAADKAARCGSHQRNGLTQAQPDLIYQHGNRRDQRQSCAGEIITGAIVDREKTITAQLDLTADGGLILSRRKTAERDGIRDDQRTAQALGSEHHF